MEVVLVAGELWHLLPSLNVLVAISNNGMWTVKLCSNKILCFLTGFHAFQICGADTVQTNSIKHVNVNKQLYS